VIDELDIERAWGTINDLTRQWSSSIS